MLQNRPGLSCVAVHPHVCGEHVFFPPISSFFIGSSPRVWGTSRSPWPWPIWPRFIPTCVGNISGLVPLISIMAVHPHVCGEHSPASIERTETGGSSPRVWGTLFWQAVIKQVVRFIPTCVGNINQYYQTITPNTVHPHVCGEHPYRVQTTLPKDGSSPRVWGT